MNQVCTRRPAASHFQPLGMWKGWDSASVCVRARSCFMVELTCLTHLSLNNLYLVAAWYIVDHSPDKLYQVLPKSALPEG
jgi:hypothetical protein